MLLHIGAWKLVSKWCLVSRVSKSLFENGMWAYKSEYKLWYWRLSPSSCHTLKAPSSTDVFVFKLPRAACPAVLKGLGVTRSKAFPASTRSMGISIPGVKMFHWRAFPFFTESWNSWGLKGPLEVTGPVILTWHSFALHLEEQSVCPPQKSLQPACGDGFDPPLSWISAWMSPQSIKRGSGLGCKPKPDCSGCSVLWKERHRALPPSSIPFNSPVAIPEGLSAKMGRKTKRHWAEMKTWENPQMVKINSLTKKKKKKSESPFGRLQLRWIGSISPDLRDGAWVSASTLNTQTSFTINGEKWAPPAGNCSHLEVVA